MFPCDGPYCRSRADMPPLGSGHIFARVGEYGGLSGCASSEFRTHDGCCHGHIQGFGRFSSGRVVGDV